MLQTLDELPQNSSEAEVDNASSSPDAGVDMFYVRVVKSPSLEKGARFFLEKDDTIIGRPDCGADIVIPNDLGVSANHATIHRDGFSMVIFDMASVSGIKINGKYTTHSHILNSGDKVGIGDTEFSFHKTRKQFSERPWWRELDMLVITVMLVLMAASAVYYSVKGEVSRSNNFSELELLRRDADPLFPENTMDWRSLNLPEDVIPIQNMEKAMLHYRQAMLCYDSKSLDLRNAFSAIVAMKRVKACIPFEANPMELPFPFENIDKVILGSQEYINFHQKRVIDGYFRARYLDDIDAAIKCMESYKRLFIDKFSQVHSTEYVNGDNELLLVYSLRDR